MDMNISIKLNARYLSLPKGFQWNNIPAFSIITGVNGIGKSQLLNVIEGRDSEFIECLDADGTPYNMILATSNKGQQNIEGLIKYKNNIVERQARELDFKRELERYNRQKQDAEIILSRTDDPIVKEQQRQKANRYQNLIRQYKRELESLFVYSYELELGNISKLLSKKKEELSDLEVRENANPFFNVLMEIQDYENFIAQEEDERNKAFVKLAKEKRESKISKVRDEERSFEIINRLFKKYGFNYYTMLDPYPLDESRKGEILFQGKEGETVNYQSLSSGEKMIVKFIIWAMGKDIRGNRINTMLYDEPDAHLHPSMCKMMVEILSEISKSKEDGGSGVRIIITTHSPSTVAFSPEGSLFVMEKNSDGHKIIKPTTITEAERILSEGIFTFDKAMSQFTIAANTKKNNLLFVEGKTDVIHLNKAMEILGYDLDIETIDMHDAGALASFIKSAPHKLFGKKKMVALFDCDDAGKKAFNDIKGNDKIVVHSKMITAEQCENQSFAMIILPPANLEKYCPVEFLYPYDYLKEKDMLIKRQTKDFQFMYKAESDEEFVALANELKDGTTLRTFIVDDNKKNWFAESIKLETEKDLFAKFVPILDVIKAIIEHTAEE